MSYIVNVGCSKESGRYYAGSSDNPDLNAKTGAFKKFAEAVPSAVPDLLGSMASGSEIDFHQRVVRTA